ncbi:MAG TPA: glutamate--tRNA ligase family protein [Vicinamibacterales bacterium]|nr:glutamate--tRNA ligase family protein [Vicinamibacterales bacterium]
MLTRFAPAPTGFLHLGHVVNALHVWGAARAGRGEVVLRIEDHDRQRSRLEYETAIIEDLAWLGFKHDGDVIRQRERDHIYHKAVQRLIDRGLVYGCTCTRGEIQGSGIRDQGSGIRDQGSGIRDQGSGETRYLNTCRGKGIALGDGVGWRVIMRPGVERFDDQILGPQEQDPSGQCGDLLVRDRLGNWTYQYAVTVDDHVQRITDVIRGQDLLASTGRQIRLAKLLGRQEMPRFRHHALVMKSPAQKLSKSDHDTGIRDLRAAGWTAAKVLEKAATLMG